MPFSLVCYRRGGGKKAFLSVRDSIAAAEGQARDQSMTLTRCWARSELLRRVLQRAICDEEREGEETDVVVCEV